MFGDMFYYVDMLKKQLLNNYKIVCLIFYFCWMFGVVFVVILGMMVMFEDYILDNFRCSVWVLVLIVVGLVGIGVWVYKCVKWFYCEYLYFVDLGNKGNMVGQLYFV